MARISLALFVLGCVAHCVMSTPVEIRRPITIQPKPINSGNYELPPASFKNPVFDVKFTAEQLKSGINGENYRWRNGFIVYFDPAFNQGEYDVIMSALGELASVMCVPVQYWPSDPQGDYVHIMRGGDGSGCWSYVGRLGGRQELNLQANGCVYKGTAMHEMIHAIGYFHEQSRPDRDNFVNIFRQNMSPGTEYNFDAMPDTLTYGVPYDTRSIMHYGSYDFSSNGQPTILAKDGGEVGSQGVLTGNDLAKLRAMYGC